MTKNDTSSLVCPDFYYDNITGIILNEQKNSVLYLYLAYENAIKSGQGAGGVKKFQNMCGYYIGALFYEVLVITVNCIFIWKMFFPRIPHFYLYLVQVTLMYPQSNSEKSSVLFVVDFFNVESS